jgi:hypothetical protein
MKGFKIDVSGLNRSPIETPQNLRHDSFREIIPTVSVRRFLLAVQPLVNIYWSFAAQNFFAEQCSNEAQDQFAIRNHSKRTSLREASCICDGAIYHAYSQGCC